MGVLDVLRGVTKGVGEVSGNDTAVADIDAQQQRAREGKAEELKTQLAPLTQALNAERTRLSLYANPDDPTKPLAGKEQEYAASHDAMADIVGKMRTLLHPPPKEDPHGLAYLGARAADKLHITRDLAGHMREAQTKKVGDYYKQGNEQIDALVKSSLPYAYTPGGQAETARHKNQLEEIEARNANSGWTKNGSPVQVNGKWFQPFSNKAGENKMEPMPEGYSGPAARPGTMSQYKIQQAEFAKSIGKTPDQMTWQDEQAFQSQLYNARQPLAEKKLKIAEQKLHIDQSALALRYQQNDWKEFQDTFKQLGPMEKLQTTAQNADEYVTDPTGPGDVALTLAFFEVAKAADPGSGSGIRFTQQEQKLIQGSRGIADAAQANVERWGKGTLYDDTQREQMADVIKMAAKKTAQKEQNLLGATSELNPRATGVAATAAGVPEGPKTKALKAKKSGSNVIVVSPEDMK